MGALGKGDWKKVLTAILVLRRVANYWPQWVQAGRHLDDLGVEFQPSDIKRSLRGYWRMPIWRVGSWSSLNVAQLELEAAETPSS